MTEEYSQTDNPWPKEFLDRHGLKVEAVGEEAYRLLESLSLPETLARHLCTVYWPMAQLLAGRMSAQSELVVLGFNGAQGTGKSTAAQILARLLGAQGWRVCTLSIDDLYLSRAEREQLAAEVHPLLATRGVPGTHDLALGERLLAQLRAADPETETAIPRFNKAVDDRRPQQEWTRYIGRPDLVIFEGWCVGARPQPASMLSTPCNSLERQEDPDASWRSYVNQQLAAYQTLFSQLDLLAMLKAPSFHQVYEWRALQERGLAEAMSEVERAASRLMSPGELVRFISHYERLTRWMLTEMPSRADIVLNLDSSHRVTCVTINEASKLAG